MKRSVLCLLAVFLCAFACTSAFAAASSAPGSIASSAEWKLLELINEYRAENGLQPLSVIVGLQGAADTRAAELKTKEATNRPDGSGWASVLAENKVAYSNATQCYMKNLSNASTAPSIIINTLRNSTSASVEPFRSAVLSESFAHIGIGNADGYWLWILTGGGCTLNSCSVESQTGAIYTKGADINALSMVANIKCTHGEAHLPVSSGLCKTSGDGAVVLIKTEVGASVHLPDKPDEPVSIKLDKSSIQISKGSAAELSASLSPLSAQAFPVSWASSDPSVAAVDENGSIKGLEEGSAVITASAGSVSAQCKVTVVNSAQSILCDLEELTIGLGQKYTVGYSLVPAGSSDKVTWSTYPANSAAVKVDSEGTITTGTKTGKAYVIATTESGKTSRIRVTVVPAENAVQNIKISAAKAQVAPNGAIRLAAKVYPTSASNRKITWISSNPDIALVSSTGIVTGIKKGEATITAVASSGVSKSCVVSVQDVEITSLSFKKNAATIYAGKQGKLAPTILPKNAPAASLVWTSSDPSVVSVDQNGVVKALKAGTAQIIVSTHEGVSASVTLTVKEYAVSAIKISKRSVNVTVGASGTIRAQVGPSKATNKNIIWTSSNPAVASVDTDGRITARSAGTAVITAASESNPNVKTTCTIKVYNNLYKRSAGAYKAGKASAWINAAYIKDDTLRVQVCYYNSKPYSVDASLFGDEVLLYKSNTVILKRMPIAEGERLEGKIAPKSAQYAVYTFSLKDYPELNGLNLRSLHSNSRVG